jgi:hypothetical protein
MRIDGAIPIRAAVPARAPQPAERAARPAAAPARDASPRAAAEAALWSVLTAEERAFFEQRAALGPLTYDATSEARVNAAPRGRRLDIVG